MITGKKKLLLILFLMLFPFSIDATEIKGFRNLKFGMNIEEAKNIYPDLSIATEKDNFRIYKRNNENLTIGDITFDQVQYFFGNKGFTKVKAILIRSGFMTTDKEWSSLKGNIEAKYGASTKNLPMAFPWGLRGNSYEWLVGTTSVEIIYTYGYHSPKGSSPKSQIVLVIEDKQSKTDLGF